LTSGSIQKILFKKTGRTEESFLEFVSFMYEKITLDCIGPRGNGFGDLRGCERECWLRAAIAAVATLAAFAGGGVASAGVLSSRCRGAAGVRAAGRDVLPALSAGLQ
jgi:hypothetical protein